LFTLTELTEAPEGVPPKSPHALREHAESRGMFCCLDAIAPAIQNATGLVRQAAEALASSRPYVPFEPSAVVDTLAAPLGSELVIMMSRALILELNVARLEGALAGNTPGERFGSFIERLRDPDQAAKFFAEYPVLLAQLNRRLEDWAAFSCEFLEHLCDDWHTIRQLAGRDPGLLEGIRAGAGDTHCEGRTVLIAAFANGVKMVYKPRSLAVDEHFQDLLAWLNDRGARPSFRFTRVANRGRYGWAEFIDTASCVSEAEVARFYERQGGYLAVLYALNATDVHYENLIAAGEYPVLIDLEALFHPRLEYSAGKLDPAAAALAESVIRIGLLPMPMLASEGGVGVDFSGLSNPSGQFPRAMPAWDRVATDEMQMVRRRPEITPGNNCPRLNGQDVRALDYAESVLAGFSSVYQLLLRNRQELSAVLDRFASDDVRFIARPTQNYGTMLLESFHPDVLRDPADRLSLFERLREGGAHTSVLNRLVDAECKDLLRGDIPLFTTRPSSRHLWTSAGECVQDFFDSTAAEAVNCRINGFCQDDLDRQLWIVRASMATLAPAWSPPRGQKTQASVHKTSGQDEPSQSELLNAACALGDKLERTALRAGKEVNWLGLTFAGEKQRRLAPLGLDVYDGLPGVALFLGSLGYITRNVRYVDLARAVAATLDRRAGLYRSEWSSVGGFSGWGGVIYTLSHLSVLLHDPALGATAEGLLELLPEHIRNDDALDMIGGAAGCAAALQSLQQVRPSVGVIDAAQACGDHLLRNSLQIGNGIGWICPGATETPLTGFAHGNAGIAYGLLAASELTKDARFSDAARAAIEYERGHFSEEHSNWPDLRRGRTGVFATSWCHGAPGIGLSRLCSLRFLDDPHLKAEIDAALATTVSDCFGGAHIVCHGDLGNADILQYAANILSKPLWGIHARRQAGQVLSAAKRGDWVLENPLGLETPGFMTGLAGIGYTLLRLAHPDEVPCVLALDVPKVRQ
jgi:type 2 lantibiotic biosynthesis protein LanM